MSMDRLSRLLGHVVMPLLRPVLAIRSPHRARIVSQRVAESRPPVTTAEHGADFNVFWGDRVVGRQDQPRVELFRLQHVMLEHLAEPVQGLAPVAVVLAPEVTATSDLGGGVDLFTLHAGAEVQTDDRAAERTLVVLPGRPAEDLQPGLGVRLVPGALVDLGEGARIQVGPV